MVIVVNYGIGNIGSILNMLKKIGVEALGSSAEAEIRAAEKLILPAEVKVCATCSFWDGERHVDTEMKLVVVDHDCHGVCMVQEARKPGIHDIRKECACIWEDLEPDDLESDDEASAA